MEPKYLTVDDIAERLPRGRAWLLRKVRADERRPANMRRYSFHSWVGRDPVWTEEQAGQFVEALMAECSHGKMNTDRVKPSRAIANLTGRAGPHAALERVLSYLPEDERSLRLPKSREG